MVIIADIKIVAVAIQSLRLSFAVATSADESIILPIFRLKKYSQHLTAIDITRIIIEIPENMGDASPLASVATESLRSSKPTSSMRNDTINADIYSILP